MKFLSGRGGALRASFLFHMLRAIGNFVVDPFDLQRQLKFLGMVRVFLEKRVPLALQVVPFFLPNSCHCRHMIGPCKQCAPFFLFLIELPIDLFRSIREAKPLRCRNEGGRSAQLSIQGELWTHRDFVVPAEGTDDDLR